MNFLVRFSTNVQTSNFVKIHPMTAELFRADGQTDRHEEAFRNFAERASSLNGNILNNLSRVR